jgi:hypothetical protein
MACLVLGSVCFSLSTGSLILKQVIECLKKTDCVREQGKPLKSCFESAEADEKCSEAKKNYFACKHESV